jgi:hypothetical protein
MGRHTVHRTCPARHHARLGAARASRIARTTRVVAARGTARADTVSHVRTREIARPRPECPVHARRSMRLVLVLWLAGCARPSGWAVAASSSVVCDNVSTAYVGDWGRWDGRARESNWMLGSTPSLALIAVDGTAKLALIYVLDRHLPDWARPLLAMPVMLIESEASIHNATAGVAPGAIHP